MDEEQFLPKSLLTSTQILKLISRMLVCINPEIGNVSCQTAYIVSEIVKSLPKDSGIDMKTAVMLGLFHVFGTYHFVGEKPVQKADFTAEEIYHHYLYGYYYLKEMTPLGEQAKALLFYDKKYNPQIAAKIPQVEYASLVFTCQNIRDMIIDTCGNYFGSDIEKYGFSKFNPKYLNIFNRLDINRVISKRIAYNTYTQKLDEVFDSLEFTEKETFQLLKIMIYIIDFKSTQTVQHTIHAACYACAMALQKGCSKDESNEMFTAGILHDLGKISVPNSILESPEKLSSFEYRVMQMHVEETESILHGVVDNKLLYIAVRHHEKLNGTGYPEKLTAKDLTVQQRLMTVADLLSALFDKRSYKEKFSKEQIVAIYQSMADKGEIEDTVPENINAHFESILKTGELFGLTLSVPLGNVEIQYQEELALELS